MMGFGALMRSIRAWRGMSQLELAEKTGIHRQQSISEIENGKMLPTPELAERIKQALDWDKALEQMAAAPDQIILKRSK